MLMRRKLKFTKGETGSGGKVSLLSSVSFRHPLLSGVRYCYNVLHVLSQVFDKLKTL